MIKTLLPACAAPDVPVMPPYGPPSSNWKVKHASQPTIGLAQILECYSVVTPGCIMTPGRFRAWSSNRLTPLAAGRQFRRPDLGSVHCVHDHDYSAASGRAVEGDWNCPFTAKLKVDVDDL